MKTHLIVGSVRTLRRLTQDFKKWNIKYDIIKTRLINYKGRLAGSIGLRISDADYKSLYS